MNHSILVVGSINTDYSTRGRTLPKPGETVEASEFQIALGGKGTNQAVTASRLGASVALLGRVGADEPGRAALRQIRAEGIDHSFIVEIEGVPTGAALIAVDASGEKMIVVVPGANGRLTASDVTGHADAIRSAQVVLAQLEVPIDAVLAAFRIAKAAGVRTILDPAPARPLPDELLALTDLIKPNALEAETLTGIAVHDRSSAFAAADALRRRGVGMVILPAIESGDLLVAPDGEHWLPRVKVQTVDATGAGDALAGAMAVALVEGLTSGEAGRFATAAAALSTMRFGAIAGLPRRSELMDFLAARR